MHLVEWRALDGAEAVADGAFGGGREVTGAPVRSQQVSVGVCVELDGGGGPAAQRLGERYAVALGLDVHQRSAKGADGGGERKVLVELPQLESSYAHQVSLVVDGLVSEGLHERGETAGHIAAGGGFDDGREALVIAYLNEIPLGAVVDGDRGITKGGEGDAFKHRGEMLHRRVGD